MKFSTITFILPMLLLIASCGNSKKDSEHLDHGVNPVELNEGTKWKVNIETIEGIKQMQVICAANAVYIKDVAPVSKALIDEFNLIFEKCTMTGPAHEQLHNYLLPLKAHIAEFGSCKTDCTKYLNHIAAYLGDFEKFFEE